MRKIRNIILVSSIIVAFLMGSLFQGAVFGAGESLIPAWIKNSAGWWADGQITDEDFIKSLQWLIENGILLVPSNDNLKDISEENSQINPETNQKILTFLDNCTKVSDDIALKKCIDGAKGLKEICAGFEAEIPTCNDPRLSKLADQSTISPFSDLVCNQQYGFVKMTGRYTNDANSYQMISLTLGVIDRDGKVVATGLGIIQDIEPFETKLFDASAFYDGDYKNCEIQVERITR